METKSTTQEREAEFWDNVVEQSGDGTETLRVGKDDMFDASMPWLEYLDMGAYVQEVFDHIGVRPGLKVLDLGCGKGYLAIALAHRGCVVDAIDISPKSVQRSQTRAEVSEVADKVNFQVMDCETLDYPDDHFDAVAGSFVLHHLDLPKVAAEISRVLKPQGRAAFIETIGMNPLLMAARATLPGRFGIEKASSDDESPLDRARIERIAQHFTGDVSVSFPSVVFFRMGGYLPFMNHALGRGLLNGVDKTLGAIGPLRRSSYYGVVTMAGRG